MSNYMVGVLTISSTSNITVTSIPFTPKYLRFSVASRTSTTETGNNRWGQGFYDGTTQRATAGVSNTTYSKDETRNYDSYCIAALTVPGGSINRSLSATCTGFTSDGWTMTVDKADDSWPVYVEIFG